MSTFTNQHTHTINFQCDGCGTSLDTEKFTFDSALDMAKAQGWRPVRDGDVWKHLCDDCEVIA
ncbi:hypothetical protein KFK14_12745 [Sphingobium phenoxybenzoativorans]|uniref:Uncharacterized protein n=1 Tax=Sphingobium phenoxybenzoativorans TaxID=1592790 RepID=A0A975PZN7_9SPHN|nr:hypothetical protein [Sphingobium phenoxybenzoativorans]QUT04014.1 hypothetical protein KFK14_12745 [Sphingobium phenoxybenzoativorans]